MSALFLKKDTLENIFGDPEIFFIYILFLSKFNESTNNFFGDPMIFSRCSCIQAILSIWLQFIEVVWIYLI